MAAAAGDDVGAGSDFDHEERGVAGTAVVDHAVDWRLLEASLSDLLQARLGVDHALRTEPGPQLLVDQRQQRRTRGLQPAVEIDRADHGLEAARQQRWPIAPTAARLAATQQQLRPQR